MTPDGADEILAFYDRRGYATRVGFGRTPALVVIDFSCAFTGSDGDFPGGDFSAQINETNRLLAVMRGIWPVFFTTIAYEDPARQGGLWAVKVPWLDKCRAGTRAVEIDPLLDPQSSDVLIVKHYPSAFFRTDLEAMLRARGVDTLLIAGCTTSVCVRATTIEAMQLGFRTIVALEAVGDFNPKLHAVHLRDLDARYADVMPVESVLVQLDRLRSSA